MRVYIIGNDGITLCREPPAAVNEGEIVVASNEELHAAELSGKRLLALWNALPDVERRRKVGDRGACSAASASLPAQDHEVIGIGDKASAETSFKAELLPPQHEPAHENSPAVVRGVSPAECRASLSRASVVRVFRPRLSVSSTGRSGRILIRCTMRADRRSGAPPT